MKILASFVIIFVFAIVGFGQTTNRGLKITSKPPPEYRGRNCSQSAGKVILEVSFEKTSSIGAINILKSSGCTEFDESSVRAANKIKFETALKDGEAVTVTKRVVYAYTIY